MADKSVVMMILCRDCDYYETEGRPLSVCPACGRGRLVSHPELPALSIAHIDCDAFFAAIEKRDRPELAEKPVIVGGGRRGVVSTCCYIARSYGIRSAMPMFKALKACPQAVVIRGNFEKYQEAARQIRGLMTKLTPLVQPISIDEAFLDMTGTERLHGAPPAVTLARLARDIERHVGITVSVGLSHNKLMAKIASDQDKPRGFCVIGKAETESFLAPHPPSLLPGVGKRFAEQLAKDGFTTLQDLQGAEGTELAKRYGEHGLRLSSLARGQDARPVKVDRDTKSVSAETTFESDLRNYVDLEDIVYGLAGRVSARAKEKGLKGRVLTLKLKSSQFATKTRRMTLAEPTNLAHDLFSGGQALLRGEVPGPTAKGAYRLLGLGISDLSAADDMSWSGLFDNEDTSAAKLEGAVDALRERFGDTAIGTARDRRVQARRTRRVDPHQNK